MPLLPHEIRQTELHRHLDVSARPETLFRLARERGLEPATVPLEDFRDRLWLKTPLSDLRSVLARFELFQKLQDKPEILEAIGFEGVEDCWREGTRQVELRFSPTFLCEKSGMPWEAALSAFQAGISRALQAYPEMRVGLLCIFSRDYGVDALDETIDFFLKNREHFVGFDLAGNEDLFPCRDFEEGFKRLRAAEAKITIHAGEGAGPENIWEAIELLGATRIGHGLACIQDPELMRYLEKKQICLEMCPTSNWLTQATPDLARHPLPKVLRAGIPVCINTDDPGVFGITFSHELAVCRREMRLSEQEVQLCLQHAEKNTFIYF